jgi:rhodanese-related sulfurtransferase
MIAGSRIFSVPAADAGKAAAHFKAKLELEVDPSDLNHDLKAKVPGFIILDGRKAESYTLGHIPGALNIYHADIDGKSTAQFSKTDLIVCYCSGVGCNASTKAALNLAALGFSVKELIGGLHEWEAHGYPIAIGKEPGQFQ